MNQFTVQPALQQTAFVAGAQGTPIAGLQPQIQQIVIQPTAPAPAGTTYVTTTGQPVQAPITLQNETQPAAVASGDSGQPPHPVAEFLYQLTKMLQDNNDEIIQWSNGRIKVHAPERLEGEVLHKYFRHSKFASFQRQLNYFGFRKIAGKGKMSPCMYVNEAATPDIRSLLSIKRKTNGSAARKAALAQQRATTGILPVGSQIVQINGVPTVVTAPQGTTITADLLQKALTATVNQQALANVGILPQVILQNQATAATNAVNAAATLKQATIQQATIQQAAQQQLLAAATAVPAPAAPAPNAPTPAAPATAAALVPGPATQIVADAQAPKPLNEQLYFPSDTALAALSQLQNAAKASGGDLSTLTSLSNKTGSNPQLDLINQHILRNSAANLAALGLGPQSATAALAAALPASFANVQQPAPAAPAAAAGGGPASLALTGAASAAAAAAANPAQNLFESSNLSALVGKEDKKEEEKTDKNTPKMPSSSNLLGGRMPSANSIFPDTLSSVSLSGLAMPGALSSNRLNSMISLSSLLSRDISTADFGLTSKPSAAAFAAAPSLNPLTTLTALTQTAAAAPQAATPAAPAAPTPAPGPAALLAALTAGQVPPALLAAMAPGGAAVSGAGPASALLAAAGFAPAALAPQAAPAPPAAPTPAPR